MKHLMTTVAALAATAGAVNAGALDRSGQSIAMIFEPGKYAELSFGSVSPDVAGTAIPGLGGFNSGDMAADYTQLGVAFKMDLSDSLALGLIYDQPFGANVDYPTGTGYYAAGTVAELSTDAVTMVAKYRLPSNISVYGGLRYQTFEARASIPFVLGYRVTGDKDGSAGYLVGASYEKPEIALRVAITYNSAISHTLDTFEFVGVPLPQGASTTDIETPQSVNLEFQSGIAKDTLLFGSIRWAEWSEFVIDPTFYPPGTPLVSYTGDYTTYSLGVGRKFSENFSAAISVGYEEPLGGFASNLGPSDGFKSVGLSASYTMDNVKISGGIRYVDVGDSQVTLGGGVPSASFADNHVVALGLKIGYTF